MSEPENIEIDSLAKFNKYIADRMAKDIASIYLFRGHSDSKYELQPSSYRKNKDGKNFSKVEYKLYQEMICKHPEEFSKDKTIFERLIRMQHHGLPTRLLDLTHNSLVALFFACKDCSDKYGQVILFKIPKEEIYYPPSIGDVTFVGLERELSLNKLCKYIKQELMWIFDIQKKAIESYFNKNPNLKNLFNDFFEKMNVFIHRLENIVDDNIDIMDAALSFDTMISIMEKLFEELNLTKTNAINKDNEYDFLKLAKFSLEQRIYFNKDIQNIISKLREQIGIQAKYHKLSDFLRIFTNFCFAHPPLNNERIIRQQGAFLIFPTLESNNWSIDKYCNMDGFKMERINIKNKKQIFEDLKVNGICESYLFPSLDNTAKDAKKMYPES